MNHLFGVSWGHAIIENNSRTFASSENEAQELSKVISYFTKTFSTSRIVCLQTL